MKIVAIDYGQQRIGLAISDELGMFAYPLAVVSQRDHVLQLKEVESILRGETISKVLIGLPRHMDGSEREEAAAVRVFARELEEKQFSIKLVDERLSTVQASRLMREAGKKAKEQKGSIDAAAAVVLLQSYLDCQIQ